jgi:hypothetical protein
MNKVFQPTAGFKHRCKQTTSAWTLRKETSESIFQTSYSPFNLNSTGRMSPNKCVNNWIRPLDTLTSVHSSQYVHLHPHVSGVSKKIFLRNIHTIIPEVISPMCVQLRISKASDIVKRTCKASFNVYKKASMINHNNITEAAYASDDYSTVHVLELTAC